jgi:hypothetical protein
VASGRTESDEADTLSCRSPECWLVTSVRATRLSESYDYGNEPNPADLPEFIARVAEANRERDGSPVNYVARHVVVAPTVVGDTQTRLHDGTPYVRERVRPRAVLSAADTDSGAVETLADALRDYYDAHGWEGVNPTRER